MSTPPPAEASISTRLLLRVVILLIAAWSGLCGLVLVGFRGASAGALGAGITDEAGQRLVGAYLLVLVPAYLLIALRPERYGAFLWLPVAAQAATALTVGYSIVEGDTGFGDGVLAMAAGLIFAGLLTFVWVSERRSAAAAQIEASRRDDAESAAGLPEVAARD